MAKDREFHWSCPLPAPAGETIQLAHGGGGKLTQDLIESILLPAFANRPLEARHDGAVVEIDGRRLAISTDSYVVRPLLFPGGNIGDLAVNGTVNDLAMCGARPLYLSCGLILEEGLPMETLRTVVESMSAAAKAANVFLVTGDTKVVDKGCCDGMFVNTSGIGIVEATAPIGPSSVAPGDAVLVSGDLGSHGISVLSVREGLEFEAPVVSDTAPVWAPVEALLREGLHIHCLRDLTRGGLSSAMNEIAAARRLGVEIEEAAVPVTEAVRGACEILGLDPLYVANEGRFAVILPAAESDRAVDLLRGFDVCRDTVRIGAVNDAPPGVVTSRSSIGGRRVLDMLSGEQLPRIC